MEEVLIALIIIILIIAAYYYYKHHYLPSKTKKEGMVYSAGGYPIGKYQATFINGSLVNPVV